jgi:SOS-response transcriptional repressor LexA
MTRIKVSLFLRLWDTLAQLEKETDHGLSVRLGISPGAVTQWRNGKTKAVQPQLFRRIEEKLGYLVELRPDGRWDLRKVSHGNLERDYQESLSILGPSGKRYPVVSKIAMIQGRVGYYSTDSEAPLMGEDYKDGFWFEVSDYSMDPRYTPGDLVLVQPNLHTVNGDFALVLWKENEHAVIRRVFVRHDLIAVAALNPPTNIVPLSKKELLLLSPITNVARMRWRFPHSASHSDSRSSQAFLLEDEKLMKQ